MPKANKATRQVPTWVDKTPPGTHDLEYDNGYNLAFYDGTGEDIQELQLTREEFIELKLHLAKMRGYVKKENQQ